MISAPDTAVAHPTPLPSSSVANVRRGGGSPPAVSAETMGHQEIHASSKDQLLRRRGLADIAVESSQQTARWQ